jgi:tRNA nucleotidyltransferase/poly(A) polymerase
MIPKKLKNIIFELRNEAWMEALLNQAEVFVVGGMVRDAFLNKSMKDIDLIVEGPDMNEIKRILRPFGRVDVVGEHFAVIKFRPNEHKGEDIDIAVPRIDKKVGSGHKGFQVFTNGVTLEDDLLRRDFTINSMAVDIRDGELIDPFDGLTDLENGIIRATDNTAFVEDPLRILRGIQFASRFGFDIDHETMMLMQNYAVDIKTISGERIFDELIKIINKAGDTQLALDLLHETDVDEALFDKKILKYDQGFEHLDSVSFFYVLGLLGDVDPADFLKKRLKGDNRLVKAVRTLDQVFEMLPRMNEEEDLKFMLFKAFKASPDIMDAVIIPDDVDDIALQMRLGKIPMDEDDIQIGGEDIKEIGGLSEGPEIGLIKERIFRDALMNRFNWKDRKESLEYLKKLLS